MIHCSVYSNFLLEFTIFVNIRFVKEFAKKNEITKIHKYTKNHMYTQIFTFFVAFQIMITHNTYDAT